VALESVLRLELLLLSLEINNLQKCNYSLILKIP